VACSTASGTLLRDYVNEIVTGTTPRGVQMVALDVAPEFAAKVDGKSVVTTAYTAKAVAITETGVQGFGIAVNDLLLSALVQRDIAAKNLAASCAAVNSYANMTPDCVPSISRAELAQLVTGKGNAATLFGSGDSTPVVYYRRAPFSGTQASSDIAFTSAAASLDTKALVSYYNKTNNSFTGYTSSVLGAIPAGSTTGNYVWTGTGLTVNGMVGSGDVLTGIGSAANANVYALGMVSLEKKAAVSTTTGLLSKIDGKGGTWIKVDGISPNSDGTTFDPKQRVGFAKGYPLQFNMVAAVNTATKDVGQAKVVSALVAAMQDPSYDLPGVAYLDKTKATAANVAKYTRTINAYAPLSLN